MLINADRDLIQDDLDEGSMQINDVIAAFCELAAVLNSNGENPAGYLKTPLRS